MKPNNRTDDKTKFITTFDKACLKLTITFLLDNCFLMLLICHFGKSCESLWAQTCTFYG